MDDPVRLVLLLSLIVQLFSIRVQFNWLSGASQRLLLQTTLKQSIQQTKVINDTTKLPETNYLLHKCDKHRCLYYI
jgi:hypothetical protein